jgi:hypothetical protein
MIHRESQDSQPHPPLERSIADDLRIATPSSTLDPTPIFPRNGFPDLATS